MNLIKLVPQKMSIIKRKATFPQINSTLEEREKVPRREVWNLSDRKHENFRWRKKKCIFAATNFVQEMYFILELNEKVSFSFWQYSCIDIIWSKKIVCRYEAYIFRGSFFIQNKIYISSCLFHEIPNNQLLYFCLLFTLLN